MGLNRTIKATQNDALSQVSRCLFSEKYKEKYEFSWPLISIWFLHKQAEKEHLLVHLSSWAETANLLRL